MSLDLATFLVIGSVLTVASAAILLSIGWQQPKTSGVILWWAGATFANATAIPILGLRGYLPDVLSVVIGPALVALAATLFWVASCVFERRLACPLLGVIGVIIWLAATAVPAVRASDVARQSLIAVIAGAYLLAAAIEFWRGRAEPLPARRPITILLLVHSLTFFVAVVALQPTYIGVQETVLGAFGAFQFLEYLVFTVATSVFVVALVRERMAYQHEVAAQVDSLTSMPNRGEFMRRAAARLLDALRQGSPISAVLFDLDHFKAVNDTYGHHSGDLVIQAFSKSVTTGLRSEDIVGRIGGEEFALVLPGRSAEAALAIADRIRKGFAEAARNIDGKQVGATVSAGVAEATAGTSLDQLLEQADQSLYGAKRRGRNRVHLSRPDELGETDTAVVRIA